MSYKNLDEFLQSIIDNDKQIYEGKSVMMKPGELGSLEVDADELEEYESHAFNQKKRAQKYLGNVHKDSSKERGKSLAFHARKARIKMRISPHAQGAGHYVATKAKSNSEKLRQERKAERTRINLERQRRAKARQALIKMRRGRHGDSSATSSTKPGQRGIRQ